MSHLSNPLATPNQLHTLTTLNHPLPPELQDSIRFHTARLTQAAGLLLRLPQNITAQANVLLFRFWIVEAYMKWEFSVCSSFSVLSLWAWMIWFGSVEARGLKATGITKMKSADVQNHKQDVSAATLFLTAKISAQPRSPRSITNVYTYLLSPSSPLSSPPPDTNLSAAPDIPEQYYLSESTYYAFRARILLIEGQILNALGFNMHELGFLVVGMGSVAAVAERWRGKGMITRRDVEALSGGTLGSGGVVDEEEEMARLLDEKVGA
ncbi:hypothetical protein BUE80_DR009229 [Diplocarpon rosae]|nr:hypothetical protein BUE80_DR009229 [Diplocarpon rosae]